MFFVQLQIGGLKDLDWLAGEPLQQQRQNPHLHVVDVVGALGLPHGHGLNEPFSLRQRRDAHAHSVALWGGRRVDPHREGLLGGLGPRPLGRSAEFHV